MKIPIVHGRRAGRYGYVRERMTGVYVEYSYSEVAPMLESFHNHSGDPNALENLLKFKEFISELEVLEGWTLKDWTLDDYEVGLTLHVERLATEEEVASYKAHVEGTKASQIERAAQELERAQKRYDELTADEV